MKTNAALAAASAVAVAERAGKVSRAVIKARYALIKEAHQPIHKGNN